MVVLTPNEVVEFSYLAEQLNLQIVAFSTHVCDALDKQGAPFITAPSSFRAFKRFFLALNPTIVVYSTDELSPNMQWLGKKFQSVCIYNKTIDRNSEYYRNIHEYIDKCPGIVGTMHRIFGQRLKVYGNSVTCLPCRVVVSIRYLFFQLFYGYRFGYVDMPGWFADDLILPNEEVKRVYLDHGFRDQRLNVLGSPLEDYYLSLQKKILVQQSGKMIDVLLFSQPFYKYGKNAWLQEVKLLADDCAREGISLHILHHPRDDGSAYSDLRGVTVLTGRRSNEVNMQLVMSAKLVVVKSTTLRLLPIVAGVPALYLNYCGFYPFADVQSKIDAKLHLNDIGDLGRIVDYVKSSDDWQDMQRQELSKVGAFDNDSISRLSNLIASRSERHS